jgi:pSer/pThr/pTyr-binding forkhead associated (FHA) protein
MICQEGDQYVLRDLSSRNGTWVAGQRTALAPLDHNDEIVAGRTTFRFCETRPEPATGPTGTVILSRH